MNTFIIFLVATLMGLMYIRHGVNLPDNDKKWKWIFIVMGSVMIILGMVEVIMYIMKHK